MPLFTFKTCEHFFIVNFVNNIPLKMDRSYNRPMTHQEYLKFKYSSVDDYEKPVKRKKIKNTASIKTPT